MARFVLQGAVVFALVGLGWAAAKAQTPAPNFELIVDAPAGETTIQCARGCTLMWVAAQTKGSASNDVVALIETARHISLLTGLAVSCEHRDPDSRTCGSLGVAGSHTAHDPVRVRAWSRQECDCDRVL